MIAVRLGNIGDALSPDGTRVAAVRTELSNLDIRLTAFPRGADARLTRCKMPAA